VTIDPALARKAKDVVPLVCGVGTLWWGIRLTVTWATFGVRQRIERSKMPRMIQVHNALVDPANADALVALRPRLIDAVRRVRPGLVSATLVRVDERIWQDILEWESREAAEAGDNAEMALPEAQELMALIEQSISADAGEVAHRAP
jgi:hypothetical protein